MDFLTETEAYEHICFKIFVQLSFKDLQNCRLVSSHLKKISDNPKILLRKIEELQAARYVGSSVHRARSFSLNLDNWNNICEKWLKIQRNPSSVEDALKILPKPYLKNGPFRETLTKCLLKFYNTNQYDWLNEGSSAVDMAAQVGDVQFMKFLLYIMKEEPNTVRSLKIGPPIITAIKNGNLEIIKTLAEYTNEPVVYDYKGNSSIGLAKRYGYHEIAKYLRTFKPTKIPSNKDKIMMRFLATMRSSSSKRPRS